MNKLKEYKLNELYKMDSGISTRPDQAGHGTPFVSFSTIFNNEILPDELPDLMDTTDEEQKRYSVKAGDIFITRTSENLDELAMSSVAIKDYPGATFSGFAKRLRPIQEDKTYAKFMAFFMRSEYFRRIINCKAVMTLRASFNEEIFSYVNVELPEYEYQVKCGNLFYAIEEKIRNNRKISAELEAMAKTIYDYWFLQFDFPDENGNPYKSSGGKMVWNEELKREIPEGWECRRLGDVFDFVKGKIPEKIFDSKLDGLVTYLTIEAVNDGKSKYCDKTGMILTDGEVLMIMDGAASSEVYVGYKGAIGSTFCKLQIKDEYIENNFLYLILKKLEGIFKQVNTGSTVPHANKNYISSFYICLPENRGERNGIQKEIVECIDKIIHNRIENQELLSLRDYLLPLLINGQLGFDD